VGLSTLCRSLLATLWHFQRLSVFHVKGLCCFSSLHVQYLWLASFSSSSFTLRTDLWGGNVTCVKHFYSTKKEAPTEYKYASFNDHGDPKDSSNCTKVLQTILIRGICLNINFQKMTIQHWCYPNRTQIKMCWVKATTLGSDGDGDHGVHILDFQLFYVSNIRKRLTSAAEVPHVDYVWIFLHPLSHICLWGESETS